MVTKGQLEQRIAAMEHELNSTKSKLVIVEAQRDDFKSKVVRTRIGRGVSKTASKKVKEKLEIAAKVKALLSRHHQDFVKVRHPSMASNIRIMKSAWAARKQRARFPNHRTDMLANIFNEWVAQLNASFHRNLSYEEAESIWEAE